MAPANPITDGFWIYNQLSGEIKHVNMAQWFGFYSLRVNGLWMPFTSKKEAEDYKKKHPKKDPGLLSPGLSPGTIPGMPGTGTLTDLSGFLSALTQRNTWLRIGEGLLGLMLIGIGVAALTKGTPIGSAIRKGVNVTPAGRVAKVLK